MNKKDASAAEATEAVVAAAVTGVAEATEAVVAADMVTGEAATTKEEDTKNKKS
jgi:hypothetical protein